jgi:motility quorum-sensing regulator/GCU-specific mRNA interferase toxin
MEKQRAHYTLDEIKAAFSNPDHLVNVTGVAQRGARAIDLLDEDIVAVVQELAASVCYKSMTSYHDHTIWQDVYRPTYKGIELYVKFSKRPDGQYILLSFKRRDEGDG